MTLDLYLFRHAESELNAKELGAEATIGGRSPHLKLSDFGERQAETLGNELKRKKISFDNLYSSPTIRANQTAKIVADIVGFPSDKILNSETLHEISQGDWENKLKKEIYTPEMTASINANNWQFSAPNGESQQQVGNRMYNFVYQNFINGKDLSLDTSIGLFTHGTSIKSLRALILFREIMGLDENLIRNSIRSSVENCSIAHLKYVPKGQKFEGWHEISWNEHAHLYNCGFKQEGYYSGRKLIKIMK